MDQPALPRADVDDILYSLRRMLSDPSFKASPQISAFLFYVVNEEIAGRGELIKAYSVAVDALGRPDSFDPSQNTAIRVLATRLRKALADFYEDAVDVPVRISLVRGSYRPQFAPNPPVLARANFSAPPAASPASTPVLQQVRRYHLIITVLMTLLILAITFIIWNHGSRTLEQIDEEMTPVGGVAATAEAEATMPHFWVASGKT